MGAYSFWHLLVLLFWIVVVGVPVSRILRRIGFSGWWAVLAFIPLVNLAALWVFAFARWPARPDQG
jgi:uncharacterized membrane protein YhaH (DUF805 family)